MDITQSNCQRSFFLEFSFAANVLTNSVGTPNLEGRDGLLHWAHTGLWEFSEFDSLRCMQKLFAESESAPLKNSILTEELPKRPANKVKLIANSRTPCHPALFGGCFSLAAIPNEASSSSPKLGLQMIMN